MLTALLTAMYAEGLYITGSGADLQVAPVSRMLGGLERPAGCLWGRPSGRWGMPSDLGGFQGSLSSMLPVANMPGVARTPHLLKTNSLLR